MTRVWPGSFCLQEKPAEVLGIKFLWVTMPFQEALTRFAEGEDQPESSESITCVSGGAK